jgi:hypothetical protein
MSAIAMSALCQKRTFRAAKKCRYSITSSAVASSISGTVSGLEFDYQLELGRLMSDRIDGTATGERVAAWVRE